MFYIYYVPRASRSYTRAIVEKGSLYFISCIYFSGFLVDKEASRKVIICSGIITMTLGCFLIDPYVFQASPISSAAMLCIINFGSGITQVI